MPLAAARSLTLSRSLSRALSQKENMHDHSCHTRFTVYWPAVPLSLIPLMPSASHQSPGIAAVAVSLTALTHSPAPCPAASSRLHGRVALMPTGPAALTPSLAPGALGPVRPRRCYMLLSALPPTDQPGHCRPPALPLPTAATASRTPTAVPLQISAMYHHVHRYIHRDIRLHTHMHILICMHTQVQEYMSMGR